MKRKDCVFLCGHCGAWVPAFEPFTDGACQPCHHALLRQRIRRWRTILTASFGLALGITLALVKRGQDPQRELMPWLGLTWLIAGAGALALGNWYDRRAIQARSF